MPTPQTRRYSLLHCEVPVLMSINFLKKFWQFDNVLLADRTIGRAFGTLCRLSVCLSVTFCIQAKRLDRFA